MQEDSNGKPPPPPAKKGICTLVEKHSSGGRKRDAKWYEPDNIPKIPMYADGQGRCDFSFVDRRARARRPQAHGPQVARRVRPRHRPRHVLQALPVGPAQDSQNQLPRLILFYLAFVSQHRCLIFGGWHSARLNLTPGEWRVEDGVLSALVSLSFHLDFGAGRGD